MYIFIYLYRLTYVDGAPRSEASPKAVLARGKKNASFPVSSRVARQMLVSVSAKSKDKVSDDIMAWWSRKCDFMKIKFAGRSSLYEAIALLRTVE